MVLPHLQKVFVKRINLVCEVVDVFCRSIGYVSDAGCNTCFVEVSSNANRERGFVAGDLIKNFSDRLSFDSQIEKFMLNGLMKRFACSFRNLLNQDRINVVKLKSNGFVIIRNPNRIYSGIHDLLKDALFDDLNKSVNLRGRKMRFVSKLLHILCFKVNEVRLSWAFLCVDFLTHKKGGSPEGGNRNHLSHGLKDSGATTC